MLQPAMSINPIEENSTPKTTGNLEELFRHHLGEEAAVPPRPMLWDQIDNSLLIRQNEVYRKRLAATRWVAAASLLLASLAGTGWWFGQHDQLLGGPELANTSPSAPDGRTAVGAGRTANAGATGQAQDAKRSADQAVATIAAAASAVSQDAVRRSIDSSAGNADLNGNSSNTNATHRLTANHGTELAVAQSNPSRQSVGRYAGFGENSARFQPATHNAGACRTTRSSNAALGNSSGDASATAALAARATITATGPDGQATVDTKLNAAGISSQTLAASGATVAGVTTGADAATSAATLAPSEMSLLAMRQTALQLGDGAALPVGLGTVPVEAPVETEAHRWRYGASYAVSAFNPNINFSRKGIESQFDYDRSPAFGDNSPALTETAATEYRNNLRTGLSQRIALMATRHLRGHWSLSTGAEFTQATAKSASSSAFVGEQLFDLSQGSTARPLRTTDFSYRMASIPLELRYANPAKRGWSLYGRLGGMVTALLGVRSDVEGDPEATRTYSIASAGTPYRRVTGSLRGGAGTQFRPSTGKWAFTMGPVAEIGLVSLNAHPVQSYFAQSHPYSVGLEAGVEFGR